MPDFRAVVEMIHTALRERDLIWDAVYADCHCEERRQAIANWSEGYFPIGETVRLLAQLYPSVGFSEFDIAYQRANAEAIASDLGAYLLPKLEALYKAHIAFVDEARNVCEGPRCWLPSLEPHSSAITALSHIARLVVPKTQKVATIEHAPGAPKRKRGRQVDTDTEEDRRITEKWKTSQYPTYADLANEMTSSWGKRYMARDVRLAIDRHRHRERRTKGAEQ